jgi:lipoic acid synthetase/lipoate-protein ligase A
MLAAITPSRQKLQQHGVQSVRQRITLLKDYTSLTLDQLKDHIRQTLCDDCRQLTMAEVGAVEAIEQQYLKEEFIHLL